MMPFWLQLTAALSAAVMSGCMGAAMIPFLRNMRFCEPETEQKQSGTAADSRLKPTMCGLLAVIGCLGGIALSFALYCTVCVPDRTSSDFRMETVSLLSALIWALACGCAGCIRDYRIVRRRTLYRMPLSLRFGAMFTSIMAFLLLWNLLTGTEQPTVMDFGFRRWDAGWLYYPLTAAAGTVFWLCAADAEETEGASLSTGAILLLGMTLLFMEQSQNLQAMLALTAAGGCMGCLIWNLHPDGACIGRTGSFWMSGILIGVCLVSRLHSALVLMAVVFVIDRLPVISGTGGSLQKRLKSEGVKPWQRIAVLAVFAVLSAGAAVYVYQ